MPLNVIHGGDINDDLSFCKSSKQLKVCLYVMFCLVVLSVLAEDSLCSGFLASNECGVHGFKRLWKGEVMEFGSVAYVSVSVWTSLFRSKYF